MIVYYYGGTIPLSRELETTYDLAMFAAQGYVAYSLNPRGTVGYGQSFAADHLNAWGTKTSDDIIGAVKAFVAAHPFVDAKKIGCAGASYGGFMTQYLQTRTDLFAAAARPRRDQLHLQLLGRGLLGYELQHGGLRR